MERTSRPKYITHIYRIKYVIAIANFYCSLINQDCAGYINVHFFHTNKSSKLGGRQQPIEVYRYKEQLKNS